MGLKQAAGPAFYIDPLKGDTRCAYCGNVVIVCGRRPQQAVGMVFAPQICCVTEGCPGKHIVGMVEVFNPPGTMHRTGIPTKKEDLKDAPGQPTGSDQTDD